MKCKVDGTKMLNLKLNPEHCSYLKKNSAVFLFTQCCLKKKCIREVMLSFFRVKYLTGSCNF